jgi:hypothetical protein
VRGQSSPFDACRTIVSHLRRITVMEARTNRNKLIEEIAVTSEPVRITGK